MNFRACACRGLGGHHVGLGKVEEQTSLGLTQVITIVSTIALGWAQWAFPHARRFFSEVGGEPNTIQYAMA